MATINTLVLFSIVTSHT